jgi:hypothetical protein
MNWKIVSIVIFSLSKIVATRQNGSEIEFHKMIRNCVIGKKRRFLRRPSNFKFTLRLLKSHVPNTLDQDFIVNKLSSLNMVVEQFILNAELANSSLFDEILRPSENVNVF